MFDRPRILPIDQHKRAVAELEQSAVFLLADLGNLIVQAKRSPCPHVVAELQRIRRRLKRVAIVIGS